MAAVGAGHVIVVGEVAAYAGGDGLLADVQVGGSDDLLADVRLDGFLEPADLAHGGVEVNGLLRGQWCAHDVRAFVCSLVCFLLDVGGRVGPSRLVPGLARESSRHGRLLHGPSDDLCGRPSRMPCRAIWPTCHDAGRRAAAARTVPLVRTIPSGWHHVFSASTPLRPRCVDVPRSRRLSCVLLCCVLRLRRHSPHVTTAE